MKDLLWFALRVALVGILSMTPGPAAAADAFTGGEAVVEEMETLFGGIVDSAEAPVFKDLGDGFYSVYIPLPPQVQEGLRDAVCAQALTEKARAQNLSVIAVGQAPVLPPNPIAAGHGALSDTTFPYTYWIITVNLGTQTVTKNTTLKLTGPGLKFNKSIAATYGAGGIWGIGYAPGGGVRTPGIYTLQGTVRDGGSITTKSFAINP